MKIPFYKMQGAGNDFIVINNQQLGFTTAQLTKLAQQICRHRLSVGSDAVMAVETAEHGGDFKMRFFNADGTEAEMCGNGARCLARFAYENQLAGEEMVIETIAGPVPAKRLSKRQYMVQLNDPTKVELDLSFTDAVVTSVDYVELGQPGLPHLVVNYPNLAMTELKDLQELAKKLRFWDVLPKGANVNFYEIVGNQVVVRTFERGVEDFTLACGTGAGSTAYVLVKKKLVNHPLVTLQALGGTLEVEVSENGLYLRGDTNVVAEGIIRDEDLLLE